MSSLYGGGIICAGVYTMYMSIYRIILMLIAMIITNNNDYNTNKANVAKSLSVYSLDTIIDDIMM